MYNYRPDRIELDETRKITDHKTEYLVTLNNGNKDLDVLFDTYSKDFFEAGNKIASLLLSGDCDIAELDSYIFPMAFLYRHSIELKLKSIVFRILKDNESRVEFVKETFHDLELILNKILELREPSISKDNVEWIKHYLKNISAIDKKSDSFRYPLCIRKDVEKKYFLERVFEKKTYIDLSKFANKFQKCYLILMNLDNEHYKLPNKWDSFSSEFIEDGGNYYSESVIGYEYKQRDYEPYFNSYAETAGYFLKLMLEEQKKHTADVLFLPMCYLYRNGIELALKVILIKDLKDDFQEQCKILSKKKHSIVGLWNSIRKLISDKYFANDDNADDYFDKISKCCNRLQNFDVNADIFRYPCKKDMTPYFVESKTFDYKNVSEFMESIIQAIECLDYDISAKNDTMFY